MHKIFVCDDAAEYRALLRAVLDAEKDLQVVGEACDGEECIEKLPQTGADVVLLDIKMPRMGGLEALPRLREIAPQAHVVILSTADPADVGSEAKKLGASAYVQKPMSAFDLPAAIRAHLPSLDRRLTPRTT